MKKLFAVLIVMFAGVAFAQTPAPAVSAAAPVKAEAKKVEPAKKVVKPVKKVAGKPVAKVETKSAEPAKVETKAAEAVKVVAPTKK